MTTVSDTLEQPGSAIPGEDTGESAAILGGVGRPHSDPSAANVGQPHISPRPRRVVFTVLGGGELRVDSEVAS